MTGLPERQDRICIVTGNGSIARTAGDNKELRFDAYDRLHADRLCVELNERYPGDGPFSVIPLIGESL